MQSPFKSYDLLQNSCNTHLKNTLKFTQSIIVFVSVWFRGTKSQGLNLRVWLLENIERKSTLILFAPREILIAITVITLITN